MVVLRNKFIDTKPLFYITVGPTLAPRPWQSKKPHIYVFLPHMPHFVWQSRFRRPFVFRPLFGRSNRSFFEIKSYGFWEEYSFIAAIQLYFWFTPKHSRFLNCCIMHCLGCCDNFHFSRIFVLIRKIGTGRFVQKLYVTFNYCIIKVTCFDSVVIICFQKKIRGV